MENRSIDSGIGAPRWTDFMKRAAEFRAYRDVKYFSRQAGVVTIQIDPASGLPAVAKCPKQRSEYFVSGTEPRGHCPLHSPS